MTTTILERLSLNPATLIVAPDNPNKLTPEKYRALVAEIREIGFIDAIIVRNTPNGIEIIDGAHRKDAAIELGLTLVPCDRVELDDVQAKLVRMAFARLRGEPDLTVASKTLAELEVLLPSMGMSAAEISAQLSTISGFTSQEVEDLIKATSTTADEMGMGDGGNSGAERPAREVPDTFEVVLTYTQKGTAERVKRALRRAGGKGVELGDCMLAVLAQLAEKTDAPKADEAT